MQWLCGLAQYQSQITNSQSNFSISVCNTSLNRSASLTKSEELKLLTNICAMQMNDTIIVTFASKRNVNFIIKSKAYRILVMKKMEGRWLIIAYANTNPIN